MWLETVDWREECPHRGDGGGREENQGLAVVFRNILGALPAQLCLEGPRKQGAMGRKQGLAPAEVKTAPWAGYHA